MELFPFNGEAHQKFQLEYLGDGYYKILTLCGKAVSVQASIPNQQSHLWQAFYTGGDVQKWKFEKTLRGTYVIRPKSAEVYDTDWCMGVVSDLTQIGDNVLQCPYTNNENYGDEWFLVTPDEYAFIFCAIPSVIVNAEDNTLINQTRTEALIPFRNALIQNGYSNIQLIAREMTGSELKNCLQAASVFISRSHGGVSYFSGTTMPTQTYIKLNDETGDNAIYFSNCLPVVNDNSDSEAIDFYDSFPNMKLAIFMGCETGRGGANASNFPSTMVDKDVETAIGVEGSIYYEDAEPWIATFGAELLLGKTVREAVVLAEQHLTPVVDSQDKVIDSVSGNGSGIMPIIVICGNENYCLGQ